MVTQLRLFALATLLGSLGPGVSAQAVPTARLEVERQPFLELGGDGTTSAPLLVRVFSATRTATGYAVVDASSATLLLFDPLGSLVRKVGRDGHGPGEFVAPVWVRRCSGDSLFVWDSREFRVSVFDGSGAFARLFRAPAAPSPACSRHGIIATLMRPNLLPSPQEGSRPTISVRFLSLSGDSVGGIAGLPYAIPQMFAPVTAIAILENEVYVGMAQKPEIEVYDLQGQLRRRIVFAQAPRPISREAHIRAVEGLLDAMGSRGDNRARQRAAMLATPIPKEFPAYRDMSVSPNGTIWLTTTPLGDSVTAFTALRNDGRIVGAAILPFSMRLLEAGDDYLITGYDNNDGIPKMGVFRVRQRQ